MAQPGPADVAASQVTAGAPKVKVGDKIPFDAGVWVFKPSAEQPDRIELGEVLKGKKAVVFGLPGAYTSVCSSKHVPEYNTKYQELRDAGVEVIACLSVNDAYVMRKWAEDLHVDTNKILMLGDGDASLHKELGLNQTIPGLGERARRYSMYLEDGVIKVLNLDEPGGKSYKVSGPSHMLNDLKQLHATK